MNKLAIALTFAAAWLLSGCSQTTAQGAGSAPAPAPDSGPDADSGPTESEQALAAWEAAVEEVEARCRQVQESRHLPVACQLDVVGDTARMQLTMTNRAAAETYMRAAEDELIIPFCKLINMTGQPAGVVVSLYQERVMRVGDCATMEYTDWQSADPRVQRLTAAARACQAIQNSSLPVGCAMGVLDGAPSLIVRYSSDQVSNSDLREFGRMVGDPFCEATSASGVEALVYLVEDDTQARGFNCTTGAQTAWFPVRQSPPPSRPRRTPDHDNRKVASASQLADQQFSYVRLPMRR
jgi:hypothetical protein